MRILLTGAGGFIGRHIVASPYGSGIDVLRATRADYASGEHEVALGADPWSADRLRTTIEHCRPDLILHGAGLTHASDPQPLFAVNTVLAATILRAIEASTRPPRLILIGSAAEYGPVPESSLPVHEDHACLPATLYGVSKHAQTLVGLAASRRGFPVLTVRLFNAVGLGMPKDLALPSFARRIVAAPDGGEIQVGNIEIARDFIEAAEAARILIGLARLPAWPWPTVNLCSGSAAPLAPLLRTMVDHSGKTLATRVDPALLRPDDMRTFTGSTERLAQVGLTPCLPDLPAVAKALVDEARVRGEPAALR